MSHLMTRKRKCQIYVYCVFIGLVTGFLVSNSYLSYHWRVSLVPCINTFTVAQQQRTATFVQDLDRTKLLLICVLTTRRHLESRALALYRVLIRDPYSDVIFFIGGDESYNGELPVIILKGIKDDEYPPRRKSFAMLQYVSYYYGNQFEWFMRVDDDIYINVKKLDYLLFRLNSEDLVYLGHPGLGTVGELGHIGLEGDNPYCMGGPGVLLSKRLLNGIAGRLKSCLNTTVSVHEDSELGRCIFKYYGLSCTRSPQLKILLSQNYEDASGEWIEGMTLSNYLTFHPVKNEIFTYKTFITERSNDILELENKKLRLKSEIWTMSALLTLRNNTMLGVVSDCGILRDDLNVRISWSCDYKLSYHSLRLKDWVEPSSYKGRSFSYLKARQGLVRYIGEMDIIKPVKLSLLSYRRLVPRQGLQYIYATKDGDNTIRLFFAKQQFYSIRFTDSFLSFNVTSRKIFQ